MQHIESPYESLFLLPAFNSIALFSSPLTDGTKCSVKDPQFIFYLLHVWVDCLGDVRPC